MGNLTSRNSVENKETITESDTMDMFSSTSSYDPRFADNMHGGNVYNTNHSIDIEVETINDLMHNKLQKGGGSPSDEDHLNVYNMIQKNIETYNTKNESNLPSQHNVTSDTETFLKMLEQKINNIEGGGSHAHHSMSVNSDNLNALLKNKFEEAIQKGGYTNNITRADIIYALQKGGYVDDTSSSDSDSDSLSDSSDYSSSSSSSSTNDHKKVMNKINKKGVVLNKYTAPIFGLKRHNKKREDSSDKEDSPITESATPYILSSSSLNTEDIDLISFSPKVSKKSKSRKSKY